MEKRFGKCAGGLGVAVSNGGGVRVVLLEKVGLSKDLQEGRKGVPDRGNSSCKGSEAVWSGPLGLQGLCEIRVGFSWGRPHSFAPQLPPRPGRQEESRSL